MNSPMPVLTNPAMAILTLFLGSLIFVTVLKSLTKWGFFEGWTNPLVALCVTALCLMGMYQFIDSPHQTTDQTPDDARYGDSEGFHVFLLPYAILGVLILLVLPLLTGRSLFFRDKSQPANDGGRKLKTRTQRHEIDRRWRE